MEELLGFILDIFFDFFAEVFFQFVVQVFFDLIIRVFLEKFGNKRIGNSIIAALVYLVLGSLSGGLSLVFFPHPLVHPSRYHGISLLVSPVITGLVMAFVGAQLRRRDREVIRIESFWYGFTFAFGMALIRFIFVTQ